MIELLWLLLPVAAASGWLAARKQEQQGSGISSRLSPDYFKGLNHLLNEEPDQAIDVFIKLIDVNSDTVETHLALGHLFRRRGEVDRAIRIHKNLIKRMTLDLQQHDLALFELAQDYRSAGLMDRAEDLFQELITSKTHKVQALHQLLDIYQHQQDWEKAIHIAQQLVKFDKAPMQSQIAQYYCEQAESYRQRGQSDKAQHVIRDALTMDSNCVRASFLEGQLALEKGHQEQAISAFQRVEQQDPDYLTEVMVPLQRCYQEIEHSEQFTRYLHHILECYGGITPMLMLAKMIRQQEGEQQAVDFIVKQLHLHPSLSGLDYLFDLALPKGKCITHDHLCLLKDMTRKWLENNQAYQCTGCGYQTKKFYWRCPRCQQWSTLKFSNDNELLS